MTPAEELPRYRRSLILRADHDSYAVVVSDDGKGRVGIKWDPDDPDVGDEMYVRIDEVDAERLREWLTTGEVLPARGPGAPTIPELRDEVSRLRGRLGEQGYPREEGGELFVDPAIGEAVRSLTAAASTLLRASNVRDFAAATDALARALGHVDAWMPGGTKAVVR